MQSHHEWKRGGREHFIPIRKDELLDLLCKTNALSAEDQEQFRKFARILSATFHFEYHQRLEELKNSYAPFDPDSDTAELNKPDESELERKASRLFSDFDSLLERANFLKLSHDEVAAAVKDVSVGGINLQIDWQIFDRLELYCRGEGTSFKSKRSAKHWFKVQRFEVPSFQRLVVIFRLKKEAKIGPHNDSTNVYLKIFKAIPKADLEMLLPGTQVRMTLTDRAKIVLPTITGLFATGVKIVQGALVIAFAGIYGLLAFLGLAGGTIGYGVRSYFGYLQTKQKYQLHLTQSLYYLNLDNNAGVLFRLLDEAEEQECREAILAYYFLWQFSDPSGRSAEQLDAAIEAFLKEALNHDVDFEVADALAKLLRLNLLRESSPGKYNIVPLETALRSLDEAWDNYFDFDPPNSKTAAA